MTSERGANLASPQSTMRRFPTCGGSGIITRRWATLRPYEWAHYAEVPFQPLHKPLVRESRHDRHHGSALSAGQGRPGSAGAL